MSYLRFLFVLLPFMTNMAMAQEISAYRAPDQTYEELRTQYLQSEKFAVGNKPEKFKVPMDRLDVSKVPEVSDDSTWRSLFTYLRDTRFLTNDPQFPRRLTWLYPDDGCYDRAELQSRYAQKRFGLKPMKIFAFGNLAAATPNSPKGYVNWWFHVSVAYKHHGVVYILDPALEPQRPLTLREWGKHIGTSTAYVGFALCNANTVNPEMDCFNPPAVDMNKTLVDQAKYLNPEWNRVSQLHRDPHQELGANPPWK